MDRQNRLAKNEYMKDWNARNRDRVNARRRERYANDKQLRDRIKSQNKQWKQENPDKVKEYISNWKANNQDRIRETDRIWRHNNPDKVKVHKQNAIGSRYNSNRKRRGKLKEYQTPVWADRKYINQLYKMAKRRSEVEGRSYHVDHIVPLNHDLVSGLHVESNLQIILASDNLRKGNSYSV